MGEFVAAVKASPMIDDSAEMFVPGEIAHRTQEHRRATGVPLPRALYEEIAALGGELKATAELDGVVTPPA
jgi:LDH2 family malate/lactate/ureidoglycolate dehydrogenase